MGELSLRWLQWYIWLQKTLDGRAVTALPTVAHLATENTRWQSCHCAAYSGTSGYRKHYMAELSLRCLQWHIWLQKTLDGRAVTALPTVAHLATENTRWESCHCAAYSGTSGYRTLDGRAVTAPTVAHLATENTRLMISGYILTNIVHSVLFHNIKLYWNKVVGKALVSTGDSFANVPGLDDPLMVIFWRAKKEHTQIRS